MAATPVALMISASLAINTPCNNTSASCSSSRSNLPNGMSRFCASTCTRFHQLYRPFPHHHLLLLLHKFKQVDTHAIHSQPPQLVDIRESGGKMDSLLHQTVPGKDFPQPTKASRKTSIKNTLLSPSQLEFLDNAKEQVVSAIAEVLFKPAKDTNVYFEGNFGPVEEIGRRVPVEVISGSLPADFPTGVYIRNGPNPQMGSQNMSSPFGKVNLLWVEGDGMIHATYFESGGKISYQNKYLETEGYKLENKRGKRLWLSAADGDPKAVSVCYLLNMFRFGKPNKRTCNTAVFSHAGRHFVIAENDSPLEINISDLSVVGEWNWDGEWPSRPFTSHPKLVRDTNELVIFGFNVAKPYYVTGIISADGERITHKCDLELERCIFSHEVCITQRYNLILDWPLTVSPDRLIKGENLICFEHDTYARIGVMPRYGDAKSVQWFNVEMGYSFHVVNSYEEGDEVVLHACRSRAPFFPSKPGMDKVEWFRRAITLTAPEAAEDPSVDGAVFTHVHEWRLNLRTGAVAERNLTGDSFSLDMPKINEKYVGYKNKYAYADVLDLDESKATGMPKYGRLVKLHLQEHGEKPIKVEFHDPGPGVFFSEPQFVARPGSIEEDDGWIVTYVHDETRGQSEVHIIDAQNFSDPPVATLCLPQRVPYGFHGSFIHGAT